MGIAKKFYPDLDIKNLTRNQAIEIYFRDYWSKMKLQGINDENLILHVFDMGVNAGIRSSIKMVQRLVKAEADGVIGPQTEGLINNYPGDIVGDYKAQRKMYYFSIARRNENLEVFLGGWLNRIDNCKFI
jgi:lysozyme family protein